MKAELAGGRERDLGPVRRCRLVPSVGRSSITVETYERLRLGMTREEVEGLLGGPGGTRQDCVSWLNNRSPINVSGSGLGNGQRSVPGIKD